MLQRSAICKNSARVPQADAIHNGNQPTCRPAFRSPGFTNSSFPLLAERDVCESSAQPASKALAPRSGWYRTHPDVPATPAALDHGLAPQLPHRPPEVPSRTKARRWKSMSKSTRCSAPAPAGSRSRPTVEELLVPAPRVPAPSATRRLSRILGADATSRSSTWAWASQRPFRRNSSSTSPFEKADGATKRHKCCVTSTLKDWQFAMALLTSGSSSFSISAIFSAANPSRARTSMVLKTVSLRPSRAFQASSQGVTRRSASSLQIRTDRDAPSTIAGGKRPLTTVHTRTAEDGSSAHVGGGGAPGVARRAASATSSNMEALTRTFPPSVPNAVLAFMDLSLTWWFTPRLLFRRERLFASSSAIHCGSFLVNNL
mmetsp:Transcript_60839/g.171440  ORF Transcript_60839/g.171440 Transcript_60839/m.171440 type:complete len:373 (+) Transcript_60839:113-1231(+)